MKSCKIIFYFESITLVLPNMDENEFEMMFDQLPDDIEKAAKEGTLNLLPEKSRKRYEGVYLA